MSAIGFGSNVQIIPPITVPASLASGGVYVTGAFKVPGPGLTVAAKTAGNSTISIQRYADQAKVFPIGAAVTANLTGGTAGNANVNDGVSYLWVEVTLTDTSSAPNAVTGFNIISSGAGH